MAKVNLKINLRGVNKLMSSPAVQKDISARAYRIAEAAGPKFEAVEAAKFHPWVARAYVQKKQGEWLSDEDVRRLLSAMDAGR